MAYCHLLKMRLLVLLLLPLFHLQRKHKDTYELIEKAKEDAFQRETRDANKSIQERLVTLLEGGKIAVPEVEPEPEPEVESEFWAFEQNDVLAAATSETASGPETLAVDDSDVTTPVLLTVEDHAHRYGRVMGSPCKVGGCTVVRETRFKKRKKK